MQNKTMKSETVIRYKVRKGDLVTVISGATRGRAAKSCSSCPSSAR